MCAHFIDCEVNASIGNDSDEAGSESAVQSPGPLSLQDLSTAVSHAPVLTCSAQC